MYSFIAPRKKNSLDTFTYMWLIFILISSLLLISVGLYLSGENSKFNIYKSEIRNKINSYKEKEKKIKDNIIYYKKVNRVFLEVDNSNKSLKSGIQNLLSLIPDQIILNKLILNKYEIKIYGYVDSPKTYKLLLDPPLKSIFDITKVGFTKIDDSKYLFSSYNKIKRVNNEKK